MFPLLGGLLSGGASLLGSIFSSNTSASNTQAQIAGQQQMQAQSEQFNAGQAQINRDYQTQMSNTAFQRSRQDAMAAGLNPMVLAGMGGASTPSGATASIGTPSVPMPQNKSPLEGLGDSVGKAVNTAVTMKTLDKLTEEISNLQATRELTRAETGLTGQRERTETHETLRRADEASLAGLRIPGARFSAQQAKDLAEIPDWLRKTVGQGAFVGGKASEAFSPVTDLVSSARSLHGMLPKERYGSRSGPAGTTTFEERFGAAYP